MRRQTRRAVNIHHDGDEDDDDDDDDDDDNDDDDDDDDWQQQQKYQQQQHTIRQAKRFPLADRAQYDLCLNSNLSLSFILGVSWLALVAFETVWEEIKVLPIFE